MEKHPGREELGSGAAVHALMRARRGHGQGTSSSYRACCPCCEHEADSVSVKPQRRVMVRPAMARRKRLAEQRLAGVFCEFL